MQWQLQSPSYIHFWKLWLYFNGILQNSLASDLVNNWSVYRHTKYMNVKQYFLCEFKEGSMIQMKHVLVKRMMQIFSQRIFQGLHLRDMYKCTIEMMSTVNKKKSWRYHETHLIFGSGMVLTWVSVPLRCSVDTSWSKY